MLHYKPTLCTLIIVQLLILGYYNWWQCLCRCGWLQLDLFTSLRIMEIHLCLIIIRKKLFIIINVRALLKEISPILTPLFNAYTIVKLLELKKKHTFLRIFYLSIYKLLITVVSLICVKGTEGIFGITQPWVD